MKELSIEEKARNYDKVREKIAIRFGSNVADEIFSQFEMSEDERIRKEIIATIHLYYGEPLENEAKEMIAWLEKQGEQKHADLPNGEDYGIDGLYHAISILEKTLGKVDGYQSDDGILEHKCAITAVKKLYNQKPAWSEEDETGLTNTIIMLKEGASLHFNKKDITKAVDFLRTLKERYTWKPSDEQINYFSKHIEYERKWNSYHALNVLSELLEQLKKLKG